MSGNFSYLENQFAVDSPPASGKTELSIEMIVEGFAAFQNFIYVAPTRELLKKTRERIDKAREEDPDAWTNRVRSIFAEPSKRAGGNDAVKRRCVRALVEAHQASGDAVLMTTKTFMELLPDIPSKESWKVILDEAVDPLVFREWSLGKKAALKDAHRKLWTEMFSVDAGTREVTARKGYVETVKGLAQGLREHGDVGHDLRNLAAAVINPAICTELVQDAPSKITVSCFLTPEYFKAFDEVIFLAALFPETVLYKLWTRCYRVKFREHPAYTADKLKDTEALFGPQLQVAHILSAGTDELRDHASKYTLQRNHRTSAAYAPRGERVIDYAIELVAGWLRRRGVKEAPAQANAWYTEDMPEPLERMAHFDARGLDEYKSNQYLVVFGVVNPDKVKMKWLVKKTGLTESEICRAHRIHNIYQTVGRILRDETDTARRTVFILGYEDAMFVHRRYKGSTWLGQIGRLPCLTAMAKRSRGQKDANARQGVTESEFQSNRRRRKAIMQAGRRRALSPMERQELGNLTGWLAARAKPRGRRHATVV
jgi:hypothetical protein